MPEIGLGKGAGAGSFAAGFGKGLTAALVGNRERSDQKEREAQRQREELLGKVLPIYLQSGVDPAELEPLFQQTFPKHFQQATKGGKKGESPFAKLAGFLGPLMGMHRQNIPIETGWPGGPVSIEMGGNTGYFGKNPPVHEPSQQPEGVSGGTLGNQPVYAPTEIPPDISQTPFGGAAEALAAPAQPAHRTLFGVPMLSEDEQLQRDVKRLRAVKSAEGDIDVDTKINMARRIYQMGGATSLEAAFDIVFPGRSGATGSITPSLLFSDQLARRRRELGRELSADEVAKERQSWEALNDRPSFYGQDRESISLEPDFGGKPFIQQTPEMRAKIDAEVTKRAAERMKATTEARVAATPVVTQTGAGPQLLDRSTATTKPITNEQGQVIGPAPTAEMRNREAARGLVVPGLNEVEKLSQQVITHIGPTQRAAAVKRGAAAVLGSDPQYRTYQDARRALAGNLAVLQQGSRPSDADIQAIWLPLVPDVFADTTQSAQMKWRLIRIMAGLPAEAGPIGGAAGTGGGATAVGKPYKDANGNWVIP